MGQENLLAIHTPVTDRRHLIVNLATPLFPSLGWHLRVFYVSGENANFWHFFASMLNAVDVPVKSFAENTGPMTELTS